MHEFIERIDVWSCLVPLPQPLELGSISVQARQYVAVRITSSSGLHADSIGHTRGLPVDLAILDLIGPVLLGRDACDIAARGADFRDATVALEQDGVLGRAWSLVEIGLTGIAASERGVPVWEFFGGVARALEVQLIEGYPLPGESDSSFVDRLLQRASQGYTAVKVAGGCYSDLNVLLGRLREVRRHTQSLRIVLDMAWTWRAARDHVDVLHALADLGVDWVEDAFPRSSIEEYRNARKIGGAHIGYGDEVSRVSDVLALADADAIDVARLDATTLGGFSAVLPLEATLSRRGIRVSFHDHGEVHQHCALAADTVDHIEVFPNDRPFDARASLCRGTVHDRISNGRLLPTLDRGLGVNLEIAQVERFAVRRGSARR